jgi:IS4 transposase
VTSLLHKESLDVTVKLSQAKKPKLRKNIRLVGLLFEGQWRFYITNIFDEAFSTQLIYDLYSKRWVIEIFFNELKHILSLSNIISKTKNGIMVEIYSALIFYLLTRIVIALAAQESSLEISSFSFKRCFELLKAFLLTRIAELFGQTKSTLIRFFKQLIESVILVGLKDKPILSS